MRKGKNYEKMSDLQEKNLNCKILFRVMRVTFEKVRMAQNYETLTKDYEKKVRIARCKLRILSEKKSITCNCYI